MREAFIGLSTPVGFDYINPATRTSADQVSSPNPVLDSPFGLMLLFDKLVFLSKSLCPENMRNLPYVEFLDESTHLPDVSKEEINFVTEVEKTSTINMRTGISFEDSLLGAGALENMGIDNHSHGLKIGNYHGMANAQEYNLAIDLLYLSKLKGRNIELVTNSRLRPVHNLTSAQWSQAKLTEVLVIDNISNYLTPQGPYHPVIEEVRDNVYLRDFRKWIINQNGTSSVAELKEMKQQVESAIQDAQDKLFLKHLDPKRHFKTVGEAMIGDLAGLVYPLAGTTKAAIDVIKDVSNPTTNRWQGFIVSAKQQLKSK